MIEEVIIIKKLFRSYRSTIILLASMVLGLILGLVLKEKASVLSPLGDLFIHLLYTVIVPLIFLTITSSISKMKTPKRLGKIMLTIFLTFIVTSVVAVLVGFIATYKTNLVNVNDTQEILNSLTEEVKEDVELNILDRTVSALTVSDFSELLSKNNMIALIVFSLIFGLALNMTKEKAKPVIEFINSANEVVMNVIKIIMYYAPVGICAYFASLIGTFGAAIAVGYLKTFIIYTIVAILFYLVIYSLYAFIAGKKKGLIKYWQNILPSTLTALSTCSSAASIPVNIECAKKIGVSNDIAETTIPLGTSFHKDGSIIGSVFKIMFLVCLFGTDITGFTGITKILGVSLVATLLIAAVPIGGGTISEMMILTLMGYPTAALPILTIIATIIDPPATVLNVVGDSATSMLVARRVDGKNWMKDKTDKQ